MMDATRYKLDTTRRGPPGRPFGWQILRRDDAVEVERSKETFRSRHEAMTDGLTVVIAWESGKRDGARR